MNVVVEEWIRKADGDFRTAGRELEADPPNYDAVCYHAQQCIEKLLKAMLIQRQTMPPRTHDLVVLGQMLAAVLPNWSWPTDELRLLTRAAVAFRYPGETADEPEAKASLCVCARVRTRLLLLANS